MKIKYQSIQDERSESGRSDSITYYGSYEEMSALLEEQQISPEDSGRKVVSAMVSQSEGDLWQCEIKYQNSLGNPSVSAPDDSYGKKSAQLSGGMLSMPLESLSCGGQGGDCRSVMVEYRDKRCFERQRRCQIQVVEVDQRASGRQGQQRKGMANSQSPAETRRRVLRRCDVSGDGIGEISVARARRQNDRGQIE